MAGCSVARRRSVVLFVCLILVAGLEGHLCAQGNPKDIEARLKGAYQGKIVTLRNSYSGEQLRYNHEGRLLKGGPSGPWTVYGRIEIKALKLRRERLEIRGHRVLLAYDGKGGKFRHVRGGKVGIEVEVPRESVDEGQLEKALQQIFLSGEQQIPAEVSSFWKDFLAGRPAAPPPPREGTFRIGGDVSPPVCIDCPPPEYPEPTRRAKYEGVVVLFAIIDVDGRIVRDSIRILRPAGMGLDEQAVRAVESWRFKPSMRQGKPVPVTMVLEINFRLLH